MEISIPVESTNEMNAFSSVTSVLFPTAIITPVSTESSGTLTAIRAKYLLFGDKLVTGFPFGSNTPSHSIKTREDGLDNTTIRSDWCCTQNQSVSTLENPSFETDNWTSSPSLAFNPTDPFEPVLSSLIPPNRFLTDTWAPAIPLADSSVTRICIVAADETRSEE